MKTQFLAGLCTLSEPRTVALVVSLLLAILAATGMLLPADVGGGFLAPGGGGGSNGPG